MNELKWTNALTKTLNYMQLTWYGWTEGENLPRLTKNCGASKISGNFCFKWAFMLLQDITICKGTIKTWKNWKITVTIIISTSNIHLIITITIVDKLIKQIVKVEIISLEKSSLQPRRAQTKNRNMNCPRNPPESKITLINFGKAGSIISRS